MSELRPLSELDVRELDGVVFDVDDTVTRGGVLEREAFDAMWTLRELGLVTIAATGRPLGWSDAWASSWPITAAVGENGAGWALRRGGVVELGSFDPPEAQVAQRAALDRVLARVRAALPEVLLATDQPARRADLAFDVGERAKLAPETVRALVAIIEGEGQRCVVSSVHAHAIPGAWNKASGVIRAAASLGIDAERLRARFVFVGDSGNDEAAFAFFGRTVGVANVAEHLGTILTPPRFLTSLDRGRGFAELVRHIAAARS